MSYMRQTTLLGIVLLLVCLPGCGPTENDRSAPSATTKQGVPPVLTPAFKSQVDEIARAVEAAQSTVKLYHQNLRNIPKALFEPKAIAEVDETASIGSKIALIYLSAVPGSPPAWPQRSFQGRSSRVSQLSHQLTELCTLSRTFQSRLIAAFGSDRVHRLCGKTKRDPSPDLNVNTLANLVYQSMIGRTATQRKNLLLLAAFDDVRALYPLLGLPTINAGKASKTLFNLDALDIGLISAAAHPPHMEHLAKLITSTQLSPRVRSRLIFALAWHRHPAASKVISELFEGDAAQTTRSNDALIALLSRVQNQTTLRQILSLEYEKAKTSARRVAALNPALLGFKYWGQLITQTLSTQVNHAQSWRDLKQSDLGDHVDWHSVLRATESNGDLADLIRRLIQLDGKLNQSQCESFRSKASSLSKKHARENLIALVHRNGCSSPSALRAAMIHGSPMATLLIGESAQQPNDFFIERLSNSAHSVASTTAQALLLKPQTVKTLKPLSKYTSALATQLKPKMQNFYILRLLRRLIVENASSASPTQYDDEFLRKLKPFATGQVGAIHTDALLILESIGSTKSRKIIRSTLKALNPGQVKVKLMSRFGHFLQ